MVQGQTSSPSVDKSWKKRLTQKDVQHAQRNVMACGVAVFLLYFDMNVFFLSAVLQIRRTVIWYIAPSDKMTDLQSLSVYLKEQDEKDYKAALGCQDMSLNSSSFWSYGRPSLDLSHVFRNNQFQLASQSQQSHKSWTNDSDYLGEEVWRPLGVTDDDLFLWIERLRKSWEVMGVSVSSCGIEVVVGASMGNHGANICPQILSL